MDIAFKIDPERLTLNDRIAFEDAGKMTWRELRDALANHMVDETGQWVDLPKAKEILGKLTDSHLNEVIDKFAEAINQTNRRTLPLAGQTS